MRIEVMRIRGCVDMKFGVCYPVVCINSWRDAVPSVRVLVGRPAQAGSTGVGAYEHLISAGEVHRKKQGISLMMPLGFD